MRIVKEDQQSEAGVLPDPEIFEKMSAYNHRLLDAGVMLTAEGLLPSSKGMRVKFEGDKRSVIDGPFAEAKELVGGFWILQRASRDEVLDWVKQAPFDGGTEIEIRQVGELEDYGDAILDSVVKQERAMQNELDARRAQ